jgi:flavin reductase (DIM6/NTAB) family NADH-FMN oxidoreductase RutF
MQQQEISEALRKALRRLPGPVAVVTSLEPASGAPAGMIASAVIPVSLAPPSMLVAIHQGASIHGVITGSGRFCINLLGVGQRGYVDLFMDRTMRAQRFDSPEWEYDEGLPWLPKACANIFCQVKETLAYGTHELFIGDVDNVRSGQGEASPLGWIEGDFAQLGRIV